ncbi:MAG: Ig-like domain-containing protein [Clostridia bacterium]|nr:Ig-like domain-containing protein [Clostridia bacterium]
MKKFLSLALVISIIISTITMTNVFVANAAGIDDSLAFDLDFTNYNSASTETNKGIKNAKDGSTTGISTSGSMVKGTDTVNGKEIPYIEAQANSDGINVVNSAVNNSADLTVEAWINDVSIMGHMFLYGNGSGNWQLQVCSTGGTPLGWAFKDGPGGNDGQMTQNSPALNAWKHLVITLDRSTENTNREITVYENGELVNSKLVDIGKVYSSSNVGTDSPFRISGGSYYSLGCRTKFADVKIYTDLMTEAEAKAKYDAEKVNYGIAGSAEEPGTGGDTDEPITDERLAFDLDFTDYDPALTGNKGIKNAKDGSTAGITTSGNMVKGSEIINGKTVHYLDSTEDTDGIDVVNAAINSSPDITVEAWVKNDTINRHLFLYGNKTGGIWQFQISSYQNRWIPQQSSQQNGSFPMEIGQWQHIVATLDRATDSKDATLKIYVDGENVYDKAYTNQSVYLSTADGTDPPFRISGGSYGSQGCDTKFADVKLYTGILTEAEVKEKFNAENETYGIEDTTEQPEPEQPGPEQPGTDEPGTDEPGTITNKVLIDEDFSGSEYVVGQAPPTNKGLTYWSSGTENDSSDFKVLQTEKGDKYIAGVSNTVSKSSQVVYDFNPDITKGPICLEMTVKGYEPNSTGQGTGARELFRFYSNNTYKSFGNLTPAAVLSSTSCKISDDGFYHLKLILSKDASDNYLIDIYPTPGSNSFVRVDSTAYMAMKSVQKIMLAHIYPQKDSELGTTGFAISEFKAYYLDIPELEGDTSIDNLAEGDKTFDAKFSTDMDLTSLKEAEYVLTEQGTEKTVPVSFKAYNGETKTLTIQLDAALLPDATYNLTVNGITSAEGMAFDGENMMTVARAKSANLPTAATITSVGATSVSASVTLPGGARTTYVFMVFDATGRVKGAMMGEISSESNTITVAVESGIKTGDTAKLIFWEKTGETGFVPVTMKPVVVSVGE